MYFKMSRQKGGRSVKVYRFCLADFRGKILRGSRFSDKLMMSEERESVVHVRHFATISIILMIGKGG